jgi:hypothetical protein
MEDVELSAANHFVSSYFCRKFESCLPCTVYKAAVQPVWLALARQLTRVVHIGLATSRDRHRSRGTASALEVGILRAAADRSSALAGPAIVGLQCLSFGRGALVTPAVVCARPS